MFGGALQKPTSPIAAPITAKVQKPKRTKIIEEKLIVENL
jgi:hypothetical protein